MVRVFGSDFDPLDQWHHGTPVVEFTLPTKAERSVEFADVLQAFERRLGGQWTYSRSEEADPVSGSFLEVVEMLRSSRRGAAGPAGGGGLMARDRGEWWISGRCEAFGSGSVSDELGELVELVLRVPGGRVRGKDLFANSLRLLAEDETFGMYSWALTWWGSDVVSRLDLEALGQSFTVHWSPDRERVCALWCGSPRDFWLERGREALWAATRGLGIRIRSCEVGDKPSLVELFWRRCANGDVRTALGSSLTVELP